MPAQGRKDILPDPINTPGIYLLVFVQNSLIQTNLLLQQHVIDTKPGLHDRARVFKAVDGPSKATQEEGEACRNIKQIRQQLVYLWDFFHSPSPGIATYYRKLGCQLLVTTQLPSLPWAHKDSQAFGFVTENLFKAESKKPNRQKKDRHWLLYCSTNEEILWLTSFLC